MYLSCFRESRAFVEALACAHGTLLSLVRGSALAMSLVSGGSDDSSVAVVTKDTMKVGVDSGGNYSCYDYDDDGTFTPVHEDIWFQLVLLLLYRSLPAHPRSCALLSIGTRASADFAAARTKQTAIRHFGAIRFVQTCVSAPFQIF